MAVGFSLKRWKRQKHSEETETFFCFIPSSQFEAGESLMLSLI